MSEGATRPLLGKSLSAVTWAGSLGVLGLTLLHGLTGDGVLPLVWLHAMAAWFPLAAIPFLGIALLRREPRQGVPGAVTLVLWAVYNRPPWPSGPAEGEALRVASSNALMVNPTPVALVEEILAYDADVVVFQELTPDIQAAMRGRYPHTREHPARHSFGVGAYSRFPIVEERLVSIGGVDWQRVRIDKNGRTVEIWNVHTLPPFTGANHQVWLQQVAAIGSQAGKVRDPLVIAGDFNLTRHHQGYRQLTRSTTDAFRDCGRWVASTWPNPGLFPWPMPPIRLDHVFLANGVRCSAIEVGIGAGSDHRPIVVDLVF